MEDKPDLKPSKVPELSPDRLDRVCQVLGELLDEALAQRVQLCEREVRAKAQDGVLDCRPVVPVQLRYVRDVHGDRVGPADDVDLDPDLGRAADELRGGVLAFDREKLGDGRGAKPVSSGRAEFKGGQDVLCEGGRVDELCERLVRLEREAGKEGSGFR